MKTPAAIWVFLIVSAALLGVQSSRGAGVVTNCTEAALRAAISGGGTVIFACDGTISLSNTITVASDTFLDASTNQIIVSGNGAIRVFLVSTNVRFSINHLTITNGYATNAGAGVLNDGGVLNITNSTFCGNAVFGDLTPSYSFVEGQTAMGGAIANVGALQVVGCTFSNNTVIGGPGGMAYGGQMGPAGGGGEGGAIWNAGFLVASACTFSSNSAVGGKGGTGAAGNWFPPNTSGYPGGPGGDAAGAIFNSGTARLVNCTLAANVGTGGAGGQGGPGYQISPDYPPGQPGGNGMPGANIGGLDDNSGECYLTNCTIAFNFGAGVSTIATNGAKLINTLLSQNLPDGNGSGSMTDLGHNLSSDTTCVFTNSGSLTNIYPLLGVLTTNGGPTLTVALLAGSRAIDAADTTAAPTVDQRGVARPFGDAADIGAYEFNQPTNPGPGTVVMECTEAALRGAMCGGEHVTFACDGIISVSSTLVISTNTFIDAANHKISIQGNGVRVFQVAANGSLLLADLVIAGGNAYEGAGVQNLGGILNASNCVFSGNIALRGGAIQNNGGVVQLSRCIFVQNHVAPWTGERSGSAWGGAVDNSGTLTADLCTFAGNSASGTDGLSGSWYGNPGDPGGNAMGGAIYNSQTLSISRSTFTNNFVGAGNGGAGHFGPHGDMGYSGGSGAPGGTGGRAAGGAVYNGGNSSIRDSTFAFNSAVGGNGGAGGDGGAAYGYGAGGDGANGGWAGDAAGAVFSSGNLQLVNSTFAFNSAKGGQGGSGGNGGTASYSGGSGANGGSGGAAVGALYAPYSSSAMTNCTFAANSAANGAGGIAGTAGNWRASAGLPGAPGIASGGIEVSGGKLVNTLLAANFAGGNGGGSIVDLGHNLSSDATCGFTSPTSMNGTDPKIGTLADNGGPTWTIALLPTSPAIDAGDDTSAGAEDQRGFPRPVGVASDIGAFEYGSPAQLTLIPNSGGGLDVNILGARMRAYCLEVSDNLRDWHPVCTNQFNECGVTSFHDTNAAPAQKFYRVKLP